MIEVKGLREEIGDSAKMFSETGLFRTFPGSQSKKEKGKDNNTLSHAVIMNMSNFNRKNWSQGKDCRENVRSGLELCSAELFIFFTIHCF